MHTTKQPQLPKGRIASDKEIAKAADQIIKKNLGTYSSAEQFIEQLKIQQQHAGALSGHSHYAHAYPDWSPADIDKLFEILMAKLKEIERGK